MSELDTVIALLCLEMKALEKTASSIEGVILNPQDYDEARQVRDSQLCEQSGKELIHSLKCVLNHLYLKRDYDDWQSREYYELMCSCGPRLHC